MEKNAYHTIFIQNLRTVLKDFTEILLFYFHLSNLSAQKNMILILVKKMLIRIFSYMKIV